MSPQATTALHRNSPAASVARQAVAHSKPTAAVARAALTRVGLSFPGPSHGSPLALTSRASAKTYSAVAWVPHGKGRSEAPIWLGSIRYAGIRQRSARVAPFHKGPGSAAG